MITQLQPIAVVFTIPEDSLPAGARQAQGAASTRPVEAYDREQQQQARHGHAARPSTTRSIPRTGTVKLKALFPNADSALFPNQFVNARLLLDVQRGATLVPVAAIQRGAQGAFVYVVKPDTPSRCARSRSA